MGQIKIKFQSKDSITITADCYKVEESAPYILLFHQAGSSRGEYKEIAGKLTNLGYNCLAVDLRSGNEMNFVTNETAACAREKNLPAGYLDAEKDMNAAIDYAYEKSGQEVILFGSSYSASLSLKIANETSKVKAVVAFSPGEYFNTDLIIKDQLQDFNKPVFIASTKKEAEYMDELTTYIADKYKTLFKPTNGNGVHGARALWASNSSSDEYWLAMLVFFSKMAPK
ncbi:MAG: dienelactone hydrolase family protein [Bacteroidales bacterium]|nr:dienelactone hydrolase family protein [Bacteroidales bacterium]